METIPDATLQALGFHHSPLSYLEEEIPRFVDVIDKSELVIKLEDNGQLITDSENEKVRKRLECVAKRKARRNNLRAFVRQALAIGSVTPLLSSPALSSRFFVPALLFCLGSPTPLLSYLPMFASLSCLELPTPLLSCPLMPASLSRPLMSALLSCPPIPALLSLLVPALLFLPMPASASHSMLGSVPTRLISSALRIFKQALLDEPLGRQLTSPSLPELLCPFSILGLLPKKSNCKRPFNTTFINSCPLVANHTAKEIDSSFGKCEYPAQVKLNRLW